MWPILGIANGSRPCPYELASNASREYQALSNCTGPIPLEQSFNDEGSDCAHWEEACFGRELMTPLISSGANPFSRVTIASLEDIGYEVDYEAADSFTTSDLSCRCRCDAGCAEVSSNDSSKELSEEGRASAIAYGKQMLANLTDAQLLVDFTDARLSKQTFPGNNIAVSVAYAEDGNVYSVLVRADD